MGHNHCRSSREVDSHSSAADLFAFQAVVALPLVMVLDCPGACHSALEGDLVPLAPVHRTPAVVDHPWKTLEVVVVVVAPDWPLERQGLVVRVE